MLTRGQCKGHKNNPADAPSCMHVTPVGDRRPAGEIRPVSRPGKVCGHDRCDDCTITFQGWFQYDGVYAFLNETHPVAGYPGTVAMEMKLEDIWLAAANDPDGQYRQRYLAFLARRHRAGRDG